MAGCDRDVTLRSCGALGGRGTTAWELSAWGGEHNSLGKLSCGFEERAADRRRCAAMVTEAPAAVAPVLSTRQLRTPHTARLMSDRPCFSAGEL